MTPVDNSRNCPIQLVKGYFIIMINTWVSVMEYQCQLNVYFDIANEYAYRKIWKIEMQPKFQF